MLEESSVLLPAAVRTRFQGEEARGVTVPDLKTQILGEKHFLLSRDQPTLLPQDVFKLTKNGLAPPEKNNNTHTHTLTREDMSGSTHSLSASVSHTHIHDYQLNKLSMQTGPVAMETTGL